MTSTDIAANLDLVKNRIVTACHNVNRDPTQIQIVAVSKRQDPSSIQAGYELGIRDFGENYAQELEMKYHQLKNLRDINWHYIGKVQSRKIPTLVSFGATIQTIECEDQVRKIAKACELLQPQRPVPIFIQVSMEQEEQKGGIEMTEAHSLACKIISDYQQVNLRGFMSVPSRRICEQENFSEYVHLYRRLREMTERLSLNDVSLGMTEDVEAAIAAGSNILRIGTGIFGSRS